jgi:hypothetical protein
MGSRDPWKIIPVGFAIAVVSLMILGSFHVGRWSMKQQVRREVTEAIQEYKRITVTQGAGIIFAPWDRGLYVVNLTREE